MRSAARHICPAFYDWLQAQARAGLETSPLSRISLLHVQYRLLGLYGKASISHGAAQKVPIVNFHPPFARRTRKFGLLCTCAGRDVKVGITVHSRNHNNIDPITNHDKPSLSLPRALRLPADDPSEASTPV